MELLLSGLHPLSDAPADLASPANTAVQERKVTMSFGLLRLVPDAAMRLVDATSVPSTYTVVPIYMWDTVVEAMKAAATVVGPDDESFSRAIGYLFSVGEPGERESGRTARDARHRLRVKLVTSDQAYLQTTKRTSATSNPLYLTQQGVVQMLTSSAFTSWIQEHHPQQAAPSRRSTTALRPRLTTQVRKLYECVEFAAEPHISQLILCRRHSISEGIQ
jgi:hypothetical protein